MMIEIGYYINYKEFYDNVFTIEKNDYVMKIGAELEEFDLYLKAIESIWVVHPIKKQVYYKAKEP